MRRFALLRAMEGCMQKIRLRTRFIILFAGIMMLSLLLSTFRSNYFQHRQMVNEMREKAYALSQQMASVWDFMSIHQDRINYDANGTFNFKGLHCSLVGKSIGKLFGLKTGYVTRYVNHNPRNRDDIPDEFESVAIALFKEKKSLREVYELTEYKGAEVFRYVTPMYMEKSCLDCHGEPAGEIDVVGFPKEGWKVGDLGGALSIIMPADSYMVGNKVNTYQEIAFFSGCMLVFILITYYATAHLVTNPLDKLKLEIEQVKTGNFNVNLAAIEAQGEINELACEFDDMTKELRTLYNDLEDKVKLRTQDLARANDILERQQTQLEAVNISLLEDNKYKSDFLAIMSHELRTPLTSIIAFTELLESGGITKADDMTAVGEIKNNGKVLLRLINNTLEMARLEAGRADFAPESVDFVDVVGAVCAAMASLIQKKELNFTKKVDDSVPVIIADREKIRSIVENLLSNAIKFSNNNGKISLSIDYDKDADMVLINVMDNGIGIGTNELKTIFEKFVQGDGSIHRPYNGSGLGLSLVWKYAELHGGKVTVASRLGEGSLFTVAIPAHAKEDGGEGENEDHAG